MHIGVDVGNAFSDANLTLTASKNITYRRREEKTLCWGNSGASRVIQRFSSCRKLGRDNGRIDQ